jgi:hypothetical protein
MHSINPETVYALTPQGHDVMQNRSIQLPIELRFLMMLINGERSVQTLRLVSPAAKYDDAGFVILMEYGLIDDVNQAASSGIQETPLFFDAKPHVMPAVESVHQATAEAETLTTSPSIEPTEISTYEVPEAAIVPVQPASIFEPVSERDEYPETLMHMPQTSMTNANYENDHVSDDDRRTVEEILKRALKENASFAIEQLRQKTHYSEFTSSIVRLEKVLRDNISGIEADALRKHFSRAFS